MREVGVSKGLAMPMSRRLSYLELWFSYFKGKSKKEATAWKYKRLILGTERNLHWNFEETEQDQHGNLIPTNFFESPRKPYILFNHLNKSKYVIDDTSLMEQSINQQDILNKRGRQIVENADQANSGEVYSTDAISEKTVSRIVGAPREKILVKGNVNNAVTRLPQNLLPNYVIQDKLDARSQIDNIFGVHAPIKGEGANSPTLGQEVLSQRGDVSRTRTMANSMEAGAERLYQGMVQMMKVFYTEDDEGKGQDISTADGNGKSLFTKDFSRRSIEAGTKIRVKAGSVLPDDPVAKAQAATQAISILDPMTIGETLGPTLGIEDPKEFAKRLMFMQLSPDRYLTEILGDKVEGADSQDEEAVAHQQAIISGEPAQPSQDPTKEHLATHQQFIESPEFKQLPPEAQQAMADHIQQEIDVTKGGLGKQEQPQEQPGQEQFVEQLVG